VLDDHNIGRDSIEFCIELALERSCETCLRCGQAFLEASRTARNKALAMYRVECYRTLHGIDDAEEAVEVGGMTFRPVWPPTEKEMAEFLFGLPPRAQWPLTYKRGRHAWVPLTALCRLITWDATSHPARGSWVVEKPGDENFDDDWEVIWGVRDDNVFPDEIAKAFDLDLVELG
jgi:hypothetical protein